MARHRGLTILLITSDRLVRADLRPARRRGACEVFEKPRPEIDDLPSLVEAALSLHSRQVGRVLVLSTDLWTQVLQLSATATGEMTSEELTQSLAFESEAFSGISAFESLGAQVALPADGGDRRFWFTQIPGSVREQVEYVIGKAGGKLVGVAHPAGIPVPLSSSRTGGGSWGRVELWPEAIACLHGTGAAQVDVHLINASPQSELGAREAENWFAQFVDSRPREALQADGRIRAEDLPEDIGEVIDLADAISLQTWFGAWASELTNVTPAVPLIRPTPKAVPKGVWFAAAGVLGVATLGACIGLHTWMNTQIKWHTDQIATVKKPAEQLKDIRKEIDAQEKTLGDIEASTGSLREDLRRCRGAFESHQERIARLLASLAETGPSEFVVQAIETTGEGIKVTGICIRPDQANQLAMKMTDQLEPLGLRITIPRKQAKRMLLDGGPYEFELLIRDASESPPPVIDPYL